MGFLPATLTSARPRLVSFHTIHVSTADNDDELFLSPQAELRRNARMISGTAYRRLDRRLRECLR